MNLKKECIKEKDIRKHYIDNIRNLTILLLFPVHTFMIWNDFGSRFYIWQGENRILSTLIVLVNPWFMPILFVLAGMSARYALGKRTNKEFIMQRINKLLIPFVSGIIFLVPIQTLYTKKYFENYKGSFGENWKYFFTHLTDFSGYDGAFTPGHLWFILFLFLISMIALVLFRYVPYKMLVTSVEKLSTIGILLLFVPIWLMYYVGNFGGFSIGKNLFLYLLGYYVLSNDLLIEKLERNKKWLTGLCLIATIVSVAMYYKFSYYGDCWVNFIGWISILILIVVGKRFLNKDTDFTRYFNKASYPIYILHQSILVTLAYYIVQINDNMFIQVFCIWGGSFLLTLLAYHLVRMIPIVRKLIGII